MKSLDALYQKAVDNEAERVLRLSVDDFLKIEDYGSIDTSTNGLKINIGFWHHKFSDHLHHVVFQTQRRAFLFFYKNYLSGVKLDNGTISRLEDKEIGDYD